MKKMMKKMMKNKNRLNLRMLLMITLVTFLTASMNCSSDEEEPAGIMVNVAELITSETGTTDSFTVVLEAVPNGDVVIDVVSSDETEANVDKASLTFTTSDWNTAQTVTITGVDDFLIDGNQTFDVTLTVSESSTDTTGYAEISIPSVSVINSDDDTAGFTVSKTNLTTAEGATTDTFTVVLNTEPDGDVIIDVVSSDATEASADKASLTFTATDWNVAQTVTVTGIDDLKADGNQTFNVTLTINGATADTTGYAALTVPAISVTNSDDDTAGFTVSKASLTTAEGATTDTFTVVLNTEPDGDVIIDVVSSDATEASVDKANLTFTATDWSVAQTVTVTGINDLMADGNQIFDVTLTINGATTDTTGYAALTVPAISVTNSDDDTAGFTIVGGPVTSAENGIDQTFTIKPNTEPDTDNTITVAINGDATEGTVSPATLSWTSADWTTAKTVTVTPVDDSLIDGNIGYNIELDPASSTETAYQLVAVQTVSVTNSDDDTAGFTIVGGPVTSAENGIDQTFTIKPNTEPDTDNTITVAITSLDESEGTVSPATLSWTSADWTTAKTVTVTPLDDGIADGNIEYNIELNPATSTETAYQSAAVQTVSVTNSDDDIAGFTIVGGPLTFAENGTAQTFTIKPNTELADNTVTVAITSLDESEGTVSPATLSWTSIDWTTAKTVTVTPINDGIADGNIVYNIELDPATSTEIAYQSVAVQTVSITNTDVYINDNGNGTVTVGNGSLTWMKCSQGQNQLDCSGTAGTYQYCSTETSDCHAGTYSGILNGGGASEVWDTCQALSASSFAGRTTWRAPTWTELTDFAGVYTVNQALFPNTPTALGFWTASSGNIQKAYFINWFSPYQWFIYSKIQRKNVRCVSSGL
ncbi:MAG: DUF1566 domain-containing protein [Spirochaetia bacterium]|nr:DUF1566 domain-containing protein [Spirochaetia bacterium]